MTEREEILRRLLVEVHTQAFGKRHHWCGIWADCSICKKVFAYGWNWSDHEEGSPPERCPTCRIPPTLIALGLDDEENWLAFREKKDCPQHDPAAILKGIP